MTTINETSDFEIIKQDPSAWYSLPQAILDDAGLSHSEKRSLLDEWEQDLVDRSAASDEGMVPEVPALIDHDDTMRERVRAAQSALGGTGASETLSLVTRIWRRITGTDQLTEPSKVTE